MIQFAVRALLSGLIVATVALTARRSPAFGALIASLPLVSLMGMLWLWHDTGDRDRLAAHVEATFWYVLPSLPMFMAIPLALRHGVNAWVAIIGGCLLTILLYLATIGIAARFGVKL
jgi:hypothetical protein